MDISEHEFTDEEILNLIEYRNNHKDLRLKDRFLALLLVSEGLELPRVACIVRKLIKTIGNCFHQYMSKGINSLNSFHYKLVLIWLTVLQLHKSWHNHTLAANCKKPRPLKSNVP